MLSQAEISREFDRVLSNGFLDALGMTLARCTLGCRRPDEFLLLSSE